MRSRDRCGSAWGPRDAAGSSPTTCSTPAASSRFAPSLPPSVRATSTSPRRRDMRLGGERFAAAAIVATIAFCAYTVTRRPGVDLGDTGGFQAAVPWPAVSARQAYPLYYALAKPFVAVL